MKGMGDCDTLTKLAEDYLVFLVSRDESVLKPHLCLDFPRRLNVTQQLKLIKQLPHFKGYGISPEAQLWEDYAVTIENGETLLSPFQFNINYKNPYNPLETELIRITLHKLVLEDGVWKIAAIVSDDEVIVLCNLSTARDGQSDTSITIDNFS